MSHEMNLKEIFGKYAGQNLKNPDRLTCDTDPVLDAMHADARHYGLKLRVQFPGRAYTRDYRTDRVNAYVEKEARGGWKVKDRFNIG